MSDESSKEWNHKFLRRKNFREWQEDIEEIRHSGRKTLDMFRKDPRYYQLPTGAWVMRLDKA